MTERRNHERRKWGRKVTYPFICSDGVLVTKNRRRLVDRRVEIADSTDKNSNEDKKPEHRIHTESQSTIGISDSQAIELENALQEETGINSNIEESIKNLELQILNTAHEEQDSKESKIITSKIPVHPLKMDSTGFQPNSSLGKNLSAKPTQNSDATLAKQESSIVDANVSGISIELNFKGNAYIFSDQDASCALGRDQNCDVAIPGRYVSRTHAIIIFKNGQFILRDDSFNGTYVRFNNGNEMHVSNEEQPLSSNGVMSLGEPIKKNSKLLIEFKLRM